MQSDLSNRRLVDVTPHSPAKWQRGTGHPHVGGCAHDTRRSNPLCLREPPLPRWFSDNAEINTALSSFLWYYIGAHDVRGLFTELSYPFGCRIR